LQRFRNNKAEDLQDTIFLKGVKEKLSSLFSLCFDTAIDAEILCKQNTEVFLVMSEENNNKYFISSLIL